MALVSSAMPTPAEVSVRGAPENSSVPKPIDWTMASSPQTAPTAMLRQI